MTDSVTPDECVWTRLTDQRAYTRACDGKISCGHIPMYPEVCSGCGRRVGVLPAAVTSNDQSYKVGALRARFADPEMPWTRPHIEQLINQIESLTRQRDKGWEAFYKLRKSVAEERYPGMTGQVRALSERTSAIETTNSVPVSDRNTIFDAMSYCRDYLSRWKGKGNSGNAQYTLDRLQGMLERTIESAQETGAEPSCDEAYYRNIEKAARSVLEEAYARDRIGPASRSIKALVDHVSRCAVSRPPPKQR